MFSNINESVINARCHNLLGCSFVGNINKIKCDPFKIQAFYQKKKEDLLNSKDPLTQGLIKNGKVVNSMPSTKVLQEDEIIFISNNFAAAPYMSDVAKQLL